MSIYQDSKDGKLYDSFRIEVQLKGIRKRGRAKSLDEAKAVEAKLLAELGAIVSGNVVPMVANLTLEEASMRAKGLLWAGQSTEVESLRKLSRIVTLIGPRTRLDDINSNTLDHLLTSLKAAGVSDATVNRYLSCLSAFLTFCKRRKWMSAELPEVEWRDEDQGRIRWITYDEEDTLMSLLPEPYASVVYLAIRTGMRAAELLSLKPDQVTPRWVHLWKTKNGHARSIPLTEGTYARLMSLLPKMPDYWKLRHEWDKARKAMGLEDDPTFVFHACRHTYATRAVQAGVNIRVLQQLMGHRTIQTTLRYAHVDDSTLSQAMVAALDFHDRGRGTVGGRELNPPPTLN